MTIDDIKNMLEEGFKLNHCEVINESPNHSNYSGDLSHIKIIIAKNFCESHFSIAVVKHKNEEYKKAKFII